MNRRGYIHTSDYFGVDANGDVWYLDPDPENDEDIKIGPFSTADRWIINNFGLLDLPYLFADLIDLEEKCATSEPAADPRGEWDVTYRESQMGAWK